MQIEELLHPSSIIELTGISFLRITDNMDLPEPEGSTPSTSGQKDFGKHPLTTEQESDSNPPLGKEDGHVSNNAGALVTGPPLLTPPVSCVASNSNPEKRTSGNEVVSGDIFDKILDPFKEVWSYHAIFHAIVKLFPGH